MNFYFSDKNPPNEKLSKHITVQRAHTWSWGVWLVCGRDLWSGWFVSVTCHRMVPKGTPRWGHHRAIWRQNQKQLPICNSVLNTVYILKSNDFIIQTGVFITYNQLVLNNRGDLNIGLRTDISNYNLDMIKPWSGTFYTQSRLDTDMIRHFEFTV